MNLDWKRNLIGQSYDGAASMRGTYNGLQSIIKKKNNQLPDGHHIQVHSKQHLIHVMHL